MTILSDNTIKKYLREGRIGIEPLKDERQIQPASVDLRLGDEFKVPNTNSRVKGKSFVIYPGDFILGTTDEYVTLPDNIVARVEGRSSIGRLGITMHVTAGFIDPGFEGKITLEIANLGNEPVVLCAGQRVCQIVFETMTTSADIPYGHPSRDSKYMYQTRPESSRINEDREKYFNNYLVYL